jgi:hypothetical protein
VVSFALWPFYSSGNRMLYPTERRLGGSQSRSRRRRGVEKTVAKRRRVEGNDLQDR